VLVLNCLDGTELGTKKKGGSKPQVSPNPKQAAVDVLVAYCRDCPDICKIIEGRITMLSGRSDQGLETPDVAAHGSSKDLPMAADTIKQPLSLFEALAHEGSGQSPSSGWSRMDLTQKCLFGGPKETARQAFMQYQPALADFQHSPIHLQARHLKIERLPKSWGIRDLQALINETPSLCMCCDIDKIMMPESGVAVVALVSERCAINWHQKLSDMIVSHPTGNFPLKVSVTGEIQESIQEDCCENKEKSLLDKMLTECKVAVQVNSENKLLTKMFDC